ncbi:arsenite efflux MFS transporter ArsK [Agrobacterium salinitolerans]|uniref:Arsenite efflux MFS transporter ArsK n=1 Tax=Agrobacterium salinitolerans TaxID=1183413 RepID=A0A9X3R1K4_9HYPH|nr:MULTISPECIES: arsenite efflux MFS transporter ArsK [Agrobacterium]MCZ7853527.1 arsenite efflux MFS transporter ArsK [Agrobacterium salinitolerans]MCZ7892194.1 arsenite efflux MFS transporter ArsK [Agrobacterium salinitolerans]MCZ7939789.1 arsenite efflux MFS transporter ArsK [Agrobacterium salinitolerans]MCZ7974749.1 arsenite efflux MFS transporter ArsK [Agrobacterium salinitolerans]TRA87652.1 arsenite efflux MFS transporter ArsK [Agrobacterium salinitolerans]
MSDNKVPVAAILALGLTQIIGYGSLYYSFSILAPAMARDLDWSLEWIFGALSAALLIGGLAAPTMGKWIDRFGAGRVMTGGSAIAAAALVACALSSGKVAFVLSLIAIETASNLVQYGAAFALLVQIKPDVAQRSITYLTLIAGFASTIFWPITTALQAHMSWQQVYLVFAALNLSVCLPLHAWLSFKVTRNRKGASREPARQVAPGLQPSIRPAAFVLMVTGFALESFVNAALLVHMVPVLSGLGLGAMAVMVGTLFGPSQVLSRFVNMVFGSGLSQLTLALISAVLLPAALIILIATAPSVPGALVFAVVFGLGSGLSSIVQGTLPLVLFGSQGYGKRQGQILSIRLVISSTAPFVLAFMMNEVGVAWALSVAALLGSAAVAAFIGIMRLMSRNHTAQLEQPA